MVEGTVLWVHCSGFLLIYFFHFFYSKSMLYLFYQYNCDDVLLEIFSALTVFYKSSGDTLYIKIHNNVSHRSTIYTKLDLKENPKRNIINCIFCKLFY